MHTSKMHVLLNPISHLLPHYQSSQTNKGNADLSHFQQDYFRMKHDQSYIQLPPAREYNLRKKIWPLQIYVYMKIKNPHLALNQSIRLRLSSHWIQNLDLQVIARFTHSALHSYRPATHVPFKELVPHYASCLSAPLSQLIRSLEIGEIATRPSRRLRTLCQYVYNRLWIKSIRLGCSDMVEVAHNKPPLLASKALKHIPRRSVPIARLKRQNNCIP